MMRVVHVVTRSHRRGAEVVALELATALEALGHENEVLTLALAADGQAVPALPPLVSATRLGVRTLALAAWRIRRRLRRHPADIVVAHGGTAAFVVAVAVPRTGGARVWQRILGLETEGWGPLRRGLWRGMARRYAGVVALTPALESEVRRLGYDGPVWVIPNARDPQRFASVDRPEAASDLRALIGAGPDVALLGFVGHLVDQKQPELAVEVVAAVLRAGCGAHLVVVGDGPRRAAVVERVERLGVGAAVTLLGHRDDPETILSGVDLALLTSRVEGIPGVAIEAQMAGCPVVSFPVGGIDAVVVDGVTGIILPRPDPDLMASLVVELLADRPRLESMGAAGAVHAERFSMDSVARQYASTFTELRARSAREAR